MNLYTETTKWETRVCDNPYKNFKAIRTLKPHGVSYNRFTEHTGHRYRKNCTCPMCSAASKGEVIGIFPEPVTIAQAKKFPMTRPLAPLPEPPKPKPIIPLQFEVPLPPSQN